MYIWLVGATPLKNMKVSWGYYSQYMEKTCSKPPTSLHITIASKKKLHSPSAREAARVMGPTASEPASVAPHPAASFDAAAAGPGRATDRGRV